MPSYSWETPRPGLESIDGRSPGSRLIASLPPSRPRWVSGSIGRALAAHSCGGSHGFGPRSTDRTVFPFHPPPRWGRRNHRRALWGSSFSLANDLIYPRPRRPRAQQRSVGQSSAGPSASRSVRSKQAGSGVVASKAAMTDPPIRQRPLFGSGQSLAYGALADPEGCGRDATALPGRVPTRQASAPR